MQKNSYFQNYKLIKVSRNERSNIIRLQLQITGSPLKNYFSTICMQRNSPEIVEMFKVYALSVGFFV